MRDFESRAGDNSVLTHHGERNGVAHSAGHDRLKPGCAHVKYTGLSMWRRLWPIHQNVRVVDGFEQDKVLARRELDHLLCFLRRVCHGLLNEHMFAAAESTHCPLVMQAIRELWGDLRYQEGS